MSVFNDIIYSNELHFDDSLSLNDLSADTEQMMDADKMMVYINELLSISTDHVFHRKKRSSLILDLIQDSTYSQNHHGFLQDMQDIYLRPIIYNSKRIFKTPDDQYMWYKELRDRYAEGTAKLASHENVFKAFPDHNVYNDQKIDMDMEIYKKTIELLPKTSVTTGEALSSAIFPDMLCGEVIHKKTTSLLRDEVVEWKLIDANSGRYGYGGDFVTITGYYMNLTHASMDGGKNAYSIFDVKKYLDDVLSVAQPGAKVVVVPHYSKDLFYEGTVTSVDKDDETLIVSLKNSATISPSLKDVKEVGYAYNATTNMFMVYPNTMDRQAMFRLSHVFDRIVAFRIRNNKEALFVKALFYNLLDVILSHMPHTNSLYKITKQLSRYKYTHNVFALNPEDTKRIADWVDLVKDTISEELVKPPTLHDIAQQDEVYKRHHQKIVCKKDGELIRDAKRTFQSSVVEIESEYKSVHTLETRIETLNRKLTTHTDIVPYLLTEGKSFPTLDELVRLRTESFKEPIHTKQCMTNLQNVLRLFEHHLSGKDLFEMSSSFVQISKKPRSQNPHLKDAWTPIMYDDYEKDVALYMGGDPMGTKDTDKLDFVDDPMEVYTEIERIDVNKELTKEDLSTHNIPPIIYNFVEMCRVLDMTFTRKYIPSLKMIALNIRHVVDIVRKDFEKKKNKQIAMKDIPAFYQKFEPSVMIAFLMLMYPYRLLPLSKNVEYNHILHQKDGNQELFHGILATLRGFFTSINANEPRKKESTDFTFSFYKTLIKHIRSRVIALDMFINRMELQGDGLHEKKKLQKARLISREYPLVKLMNTLNRQKKQYTLHATGNFYDSFGNGLRKDDLRESKKIYALSTKNVVVYSHVSLYGTYQDERIQLKRPIVTLDALYRQLYIPSKPAAQDVQHPKPEYTPTFVENTVDTMSNTISELNSYVKNKANDHKVVLSPDILDVLSMFAKGEEHTKRTLYKCKLVMKTILSRFDNGWTPDMKLISGRKHLPDTERKLYETNTASKYNTWKNCIDSYENQNTRGKESGQMQITFISMMLDIQNKVNNKYGELGKENAQVYVLQESMVLAQVLHDILETNHHQTIGMDVRINIVKYITQEMAYVIQQDNNTVDAIQRFVEAQREMDKQRKIAESDNLDKEQREIRDALRKIGADATRIIQDTNETTERQQEMREQDNQDFEEMGDFKKDYKGMDDDDDDHE
jgi:hypothetical protein